MLLVADYASTEDDDDDINEPRTMHDEPPRSDAPQPRAPYRAAAQHRTTDLQPHQPRRFQADKRRLDAENPLAASPLAASPLAASPPAASPLAASPLAASPPSRRPSDPPTDQYAAFVHLALSVTPELERAALAAADALCAATPCATPIPPAEWHASVSRGFSLQRSQIQPLLGALRVALRHCRALRLRTGGMCQLANDARSRWFAAVELAEPAAEVDAVGALVRAVDAVVERFGAERFHQPRRLHASIAWSAEEMGELPPSSGLRGHELCIREVDCLVGKRRFAIKLAR